MLTEASPAQAVDRLNELMQEAGMLDRFVTLSLGLLDATAHLVVFVNAGHLPPLIYRHGTGTIEEATDRQTAGFPLGVAEGIPYEAVSVKLNEGDCVVQFTDGVTEAKNKPGDEFTMEGVFRALRAGPFTATAMVERLVAAVKQHAVGCNQHDDITVVAFGRTGGGTHSPTAVLG